MFDWVKQCVKDILHNMNLDQFDVTKLYQWDGMCVSATECPEADRYEMT